MAGTVRMRNRILFEPTELRPGRRVRLEGSDPRAKHILNILNGGKISLGTPLRVGVVGGERGQAKIRRLPPSGNLELEWTATESGAEPELPPPRLDVLLAMPRPKALKRLWSQLASLRVGTVWITGAQKVEKSYLTSGALDPGYVYGQLLRGLEQSGDTDVPEVRKSWSLGATLGYLVGSGGTRGEAPGVPIQARRSSASPPPLPRRLLSAHPEPGGSGAGDSVDRALHGLGTERVLLAIGPEGGWAPQELEIMSPPAFRRVNLGRRPLTTETAVVGLVSVLKENMRDWS